jgi:hypothetical protein
MPECAAIGDNGALFWRAFGTMQAIEIKPDFKGDER